MAQEISQQSVGILADIIQEQEEMNRLRTERIFALLGNPELRLASPRTRRQRLLRKSRVWQEDLRTRVALRIAPWLD